MVKPLTLFLIFFIIDFRAAILHAGQVMQIMHVMSYNNNNNNKNNKQTKTKH